MRFAMLSGEPDCKPVSCEISLIQQRVNKHFLFAAYLDCFQLCLTPASSGLIIVSTYFAGKAGVVDGEANVAIASAEGYRPTASGDDVDGSNAALDAEKGHGMFSSGEHICMPTPSDLCQLLVSSCLTSSTRMITTSVLTSPTKVALPSAIRVSFEVCVPRVKVCIMSQSFDSTINCRAGFRSMR